jgi:hypothetical protein
MFTLYVARDKMKADRHDIGSILCLQVLELMPSRDVKVVDVSNIRSPPIWLTGTPTLVHENSDEVWRGNQALSRMQSMLIERPPATQKKTISEEPEQDWAVPEQEDDDESMFTKKLTSEDLAAATKKRSSSMPPVSSAPPPPFEPQKD